MILKLKEGGYVQAPRYAWDIKTIRHGSPAALSDTTHDFGGDEAAEPARPCYRIDTWPELTGFGDDIQGELCLSKSEALRLIAERLEPTPNYFPYGDGSR